MCVIGALHFALLYYYVLLYCSILYVLESTCTCGNRYNRLRYEGRTNTESAKPLAHILSPFRPCTHPLWQNQKWNTDGRLALAVTIVSSNKDKDVWKRRGIKLMEQKGVNAAKLLGGAPYHRREKILRISTTGVRIFLSLRLLRHNMQVANMVVDPTPAKV